MNRGLFEEKQAENYFENLAVILKRNFSNSLGQYFCPKVYIKNKYIYIYIRFK